jgi:hypothetical protein
MEELIIKITSDMEGAIEEAGKLAGGLSALGGIASGVLTTGLAVAGAAFTGLIAGLTFAISEAASAEVVLAQLDAVVRSMGTGFAAAEIINWAEDLSLATGIADDAITSAANTLLTFGNITHDIFEETLGLTADLAVAWKMDLDTAAKMVGKALNDPIAGLTALSKVGVTFNAEQKEMIKSLVETGDMAKAQALIMEELTRQVGGSSEAYGNTLAGSLNKVKNLFGEAAESIGSLFVPALKGLVDFILPPLTEAFEFIDGLVATLKEQFDLFTMQVDAGVDPVLAFGNVLLNLFPPWLHEAVLTLIEGLFSLRNAFANTGDETNSLISQWGSTFKAILQETLPAAISFAGESLGYFADLWQEFGPDILNILRLIGVGIQAVAPYIGQMVDNWTKHTQLMRAAFRENMGALGHDVNVTTGQLVPLFASLGNQAIQGLTRSLYANSGLVKEAFKHLARLGVSAFVEMLGIRSPSKVFEGFGRNVISGLVEGIGEDPDAMYKALKGVVDAGISNIKKDLGIASPSKLFMGMGENLMEGFSLGITNRSAAPLEAMTSAVQQVTSAAYNTQHQSFYAPIVVNYPAKSLGELLADVNMGAY